MQQTTKNTSRKKFLIWSTTLIGSFAALKFFRTAKKTETVKMLTEDGSLVEIDSSLLMSKGKKISDKELQQWVKKPATK